MLWFNSIPFDVVKSLRHIPIKSDRRVTRRPCKTVSFCLRVASCFRTGSLFTSLQGHSGEQSVSTGLLYKEGKYQPSSVCDLCRPLNANWYSTCPCTGYSLTRKTNSICNSVKYLIKHTEYLRAMLQMTALQPCA